MRDLIPVAQFKKREKHPWKSVAFSRVQKVTFSWVFFTFIKLHKLVPNRKKRVNCSSPVERSFNPFHATGLFIWGKVFKNGNFS